MTKDDTKKMIMYLRTAYKGFCDGLDLTAVVNVWHDAFRDEDVHIVSEATRNYTKSCQYLPTIAGIQKQIDLIRNPQTDAELWALIVKAAKNSTYGAVEEYEKLPDICKKFVGSPTALKDFGQIDQGTLQTVVKSQFTKSAPMIRERTNVQSGLPDSVRAAIDAAKQRMLEARYEEV